MSVLEKRRVATEKTLGHFRGKAFSWDGCSCYDLAIAHLRNMGRKTGRKHSFKTPLGVKKIMQRNGWATVADFLDDLMPGARIAPAQMLVGDLAVLAGEEAAHGIDAIVVCAGPLKFMGWREGMDGLVVLDVSLDQVSGAWRV